jgi:hypothetical protein
VHAWGDIPNNVHIVLCIESWIILIYACHQFWESHNYNTCCVFYILPFAILGFSHLIRVLLIVLHWVQSLGPAWVLTHLTSLFCACTSIFSWFCNNLFSISHRGHTTYIDRKIGYISVCFIVSFRFMEMSGPTKVVIYTSRYCAVFYSTEHIII